ARHHRAHAHPGTDRPAQRALHLPSPPAALGPRRRRHGSPARPRPPADRGSDGGPSRWERGAGPADLLDLGVALRAALAAAAHPLRHHDRRRRGRRGPRGHRRRLPQARTHRPRAGRRMIAWAIVALPAITAALLLVVSRWGTLTALLAVLSSLGSLGLALAALPRTAKGAAPFAEDRAVGPGRVMGGLDLPFALSLSGTAVFLVLIVSLVVAAVQVYSAW